MFIFGNNNNNNFIETRLQGTIGKRKNTDGLVNKLDSSWVTYESSPWGSVANRAGRNSKISRTR